MSLPVNDPKSGGLDHCHSFLTATKKNRHNYQFASKNFSFKVLEITSRNTGHFSTRVTLGLTYSKSLLPIDSIPAERLDQMSSSKHDTITNTSRGIKQKNRELKNIPPKIPTND